MVLRRAHLCRLAVAIAASRPLRARHDQRDCAVPPWTEGRLRSIGDADQTAGGPQLHSYKVPEAITSSSAISADDS